MTLSAQDGWDGLDDGDSPDLEEITLAVPPKTHPGIMNPGPMTARMTATTPSSSHVRAWARQHGYAVGDRGRLPEDVQEAYHRAHQPE